MGSDLVKRALTGAILILAASILFGAGTIADAMAYERGMKAHILGACIGFVGLIALIAAAIKKDFDPKD